MKCDKVRRLLMTDYIDGELDAPAEKLVREHLAACAPCRELERSVRTAAVTPLRAAARPEPPPHVWSRVREALSEEKAPRVAYADLAGGLRRLFALPQMRLAAVTAAMIVLVAAFVIRHYAEERALDLYIEDQMAVLSDGGAGANGTGTVEDYLSVFNGA